MREYEKVRRIMVFDTSVASDNQGDKIILEYCNDILENMYPNAYFINVPTHEIISKVTYRWSKETDFAIVCGTNLLKSNSLIRRQWKISLLDAYKINKACLLGVSWNADGKKDTIDLYTKLMYRKLLDNGFLHSVRDEYSKKMLENIGITNVVNTACPTMWGLTEEFCKKIPCNKADNVITTVTNYRPDVFKDKLMLETLVSNYDNVYLWIQSMRDIEYIQNICDIEKIKVIYGGVERYSKFLENCSSLDYIGTRLHAGIHALNYQKRTIIISVDERAENIAADTGLKVLKRSELKKNELENVLNKGFVTDIRIPYENIEKWKRQFCTK